MRILTLFAMVFALMIQPLQAQEAFPGALGFGATTIGGQGGREIQVTNLNDSGPGSYRDACLQSGPRIVTFRVGGRINLLSQLTILNPNITIAGQTAPGDGICISGARTTIRTSQVIMRGMRLRPGYNAGLQVNALQISSESNHVIIDHCSMSWARDALLNTWNPVSDITIQNCIIGEVLADHAANLGAGDKNGIMKHIQRASFLLNYVNNSKHRNPKAIWEVEALNNFVHNWMVIAADAQLNAQFDWAGNHYQKGPSFTGNNKTLILAEPTTEMKVWAFDNITPEVPSGVGDPWLSVGVPVNPAPRSYQSLTRLNSSGYVLMPASEVKEYVLANAGAFPRDEVDLRMIADARNGTGRIIANESEVGGYPTYTGSRSQAEWSAIIAAEGGLENAINSFYEVDVIPSPPWNVAASGVTDSSITLTWQYADSTNSADQLWIYRSTEAAGTYTRVASVSPVSGAYVNAGLAEETTYWYHMTAEGEDGESEPSNPVSATTLKKPNPCDSLMQVAYQQGYVAGNAAGFTAGHAAGYEAGFDAGQLDVIGDMQIYIPDPLNSMFKDTIYVIRKQDLPK